MGRGPCPGELAGRDGHLILWAVGPLTGLSLGWGLQMSFCYGCRVDLWRAGVQVVTDFSEL